MRVGINARTFLVDEPDGAVQTARTLTRRLADRNDVEVILYGHPDLEEYFAPEAQIRSSGFATNSPYFGIIWERTILPYIVRSDEIDVLLCPNGNAPFLSVGCPIITYVHDVNAQRGMSSGIHGLYRKVAVPLGVQNSDKVITVSEFSKQEILTYLPVKKEDIHVVYNGVDDFHLNSGGDEFLDLPDQYILYVGAMNPRKNIEGLIEAYDYIRDDIPHELVLIGPKNKSVYERMNVDDFSKNLITPGYVPEAQLKYAYENASAFVYPSLYEGFGLPPLEAMACGTPVISSNSTSLKEILEGFATLVDPTDPEELGQAIYDTVNSKDSEGELKKYASKFTWERAVDELRTILHNTVANSSY